MLTKTENDGCRKILEKLNFQEVQSVAQTVTNRSISVSTKSEAIKAILTYTSSAVDLLKRRKIKKDLLFIYLNDILHENNETGFTMPSDKTGLILEILKRWGTDVKDVELMDVDLQLTDDSKNQLSAPSASTEDGILNQSTSSFSAPGNNSPPQINITVQQLVNVTQVHNYSPLNQNSSNCAVTDKLNIKTLGEKFAQWFYENLNSFCPALQKSPGEFGPYHFWDESHLVIQTWNPHLEREEISDPTLISERLLLFAKKEQMLFNPNLTNEGLFVQSNAHGLVQILVCGTIHRGNDCIGIFQQLFGIIKDPRYHDNWKIKVSKLYLKAMQALTDLPKLEGNPEQQILAMSSDLRTT